MTQRTGTGPKRKIRNTKENRQKAIDELRIDVPYYRCRVAGNRLEFSLYGGGVASWPPPCAGGDAPAPADDLMGNGRQGDSSDDD